MSSADFASRSDGIIQEYRCLWHGHEPLPATYFKVCPECGHVYATAQELLDEFNNNVPADCHEPETDPARVFFCPLCVHDF